MAMEFSRFEACLQRIAKAGGRSAREARRILEEVHDRGSSLEANGEADSYVKAAQQLAEREQAAARQTKLDALRNAKVRSGLMDAVDKNGGIATAADTIRSVLHGTNVGSRDSVEARWRGVASGWTGALDAQLRKLGVEKAAISGDMDRDIAREMWAINAGEKGTATRNNPARQVAESLTGMLDLARNRLNQAGAHIGDAIDYVTHTSHDPDKIRAAAGSLRAPSDQAFEAWWKDVEPRLAEKTFDDIVPKEGQSMEDARKLFGRSVFESLVTGVHMTEGPAFGEKGFVPGGKVPYVPPAYEGTGNLARKLSEGRTLFWKNADAWSDYMEKYGGQSSLTQGAMGSLERAARKLALMEKLGTNPAANLNMVMRRIQEVYRPDVDGVRAFQAKMEGLSNVMAHLDGSANIPQNRMASRIASSIRTWESMSDLGGVGITHFASIWPTVTSEMKQHGFSGTGRLQVIGHMIGALVKGRGSAECQEIMADLGAYSHGLTRDMWARWQAETSIPGRLAAMANTFMKYTGIHYVFDNTQAAVREMLSAGLARNAGKEFGELEPHLSQMIGKYGIGEAEWNLLRSVKDLPVAEGRAYLTPKDALRIDPGQAANYLRASGALAENATEDATKAAIGRLGNELSDRLYAYYGDAAAHAVVTPGVRERAAVLGADRPGTFGGEMRRFLLQFKMWPLAAANQIIGRDIHMSLSKADAAWGLGTLMALSAAGGYFRMSVNDMALGHPLRDPTDPRTLIAALAQGGGVGILGDFLFGEVMRNRFGSGVVGTLGGPAVSDLDSFIHIYNGWLHGKMGWPDLARFAVNHIPFANLVYLKGALDYMLFYHLYEAASPGWWERTNRRMVREQGRAMAGYVPGAGVPWTPWGIGASQ